MRRPWVPPEKVPQAGDFVVQPAFPGFTITKVVEPSGAKSERVTIEESDRLRALEVASRLASEAGTKAWTYELDNQYSEIYEHGKKQ